MTLLSAPTPYEAAFEAAFTSRSATTEGQAAAFERYARLRLPNRRVEGWKWSDLNAVLRASEPSAATAPAAAPVIAPSPLSALDPIELRIVNGRVEIPEGEPPAGLRYGVLDSVATIDELEDHAVAALNVALTRKALAIEVEEGARPDRPVLIRHISAGAGFSFSQTLVRAQPGAALTLIESYEGEGAGFASHLMHMILREEAQCQRIVLQGAGGARAFHAIGAAKLDAGARFRQTSLSEGGRFSRHETIVHLCAPGATAQLDSAALLAGEAHNDFTSVTRFLAPGCEARQLHKGVARDRARNVFQGKFHVLREAQKTDARMTANALLLSEGAEANHKPELEIYADDVECAHGSTVGALDADALFYMRQRGLSETQARALLIEAFVGEALENVSDEKIRAALSQRVASWLGDLS